MKNSFYSKQVENMMHEEIELITLQYNIKQQEQLEIEYLLYNSSIKQCIIKITKNFESMKFLKNILEKMKQMT
jgi:DNA integrity scanning protein DisA with diadenylate cyclase activity